MMKLTVTVCNFVNSPKRILYIKVKGKPLEKIEEIWEDRSRWRRWDTRQ